VGGSTEFQNRQMQRKLTSLGELREEMAENVQNTLSDQGICSKYHESTVEQCCNTNLGSPSLFLLLFRLLERPDLNIIIINSKLWKAEGSGS
jgi:hypothetical protein